MISSEHIKAYNAQRKTKDKSVLCHAPFANLNFEQNGNITACCFNRVDILGTYPQNSIAEAWSGKPLKQLRQQIKSNSLDGGCKLCGILLESGNYGGTHATYYDEYASNPTGNRLQRLFGIKPREMPRVFEFEISNTCNLACTMCSGYFSSTIRKNREKLPPMPNPFDDAFVDQVAEFLPTLTDLKFLGGEPFLIDIYYKIWDRIVEINPSARVHITTNGTILNNRVKTLLEKLKAGIVLSIDSLNKENFESIRINGDLDKILRNMEYFMDYTKRKDTYLSIASCVMSNNYKDIPDLVRFANEKNLPLHFNVVWNPGHVSLRFLSYHELEEVESYLKEFEFEVKGSKSKGNISNYKELIQTVSYWKEERNFTVSLAKKEMANVDFLQQLNGHIDPFTEKIFALCLSHYTTSLQLQEEFQIPQHLQNLVQEITDNPLKIRQSLFRIYDEVGDFEFLKRFFDTLPLFHELFYGKEGLETYKEKCAQLAKYVAEQRFMQAVNSDIIADVERFSFVRQLDIMRSGELEDLKKALHEHY